MLGVMIGTALRAVARAPSTWLWSSTAAGVVAAIGAQITGDRLDLRVWLLLGFALAAANAQRGQAGAEAAEPDRQPA